MVGQPSTKRTVRARLAGFAGPAAGVLILLTTAASTMRGQDSVATAQDSVAPKPVTRAVRHRSVTIGPVGGVNFATWTGDDAGSGLTRRTGFHAGVMISAELGPVFGIQAGAMYSQEGTGVELPGSNITGTFKVDYIRIPVLLKVRAQLQGTGIRPYAVLGPTLGIKTKCQIEATDGSQTASVECDDPSVGFNLTTTDIGLVLGLGLDIDRFSAGVRYVPGLRSIDDISTDAAEVRNTLLALTAGFAF